MSVWLSIAMDAVRWGGGEVGGREIGGTCVLHEGTTYAPLCRSLDWHRQRLLGSVVVELPSVICSGWSLGHDRVINQENAGWSQGTAQGAGTFAWPTYTSLVLGI